MNHIPRVRQSGFTMVELVVTMGIFTVLIGVVLANYRSFSSNAEFANISESIALSLREAQIYGVGSKVALTACGTPASVFNCPYGISLTPGSNSYTIFVDTSENKVYDGGAEAVQNITLPGGATISSISCNPGSCTGPVNITFKRPSPDAIIVDAPNGTPFEGATVTVTNPAGKIAHVVVTATGQFSIQ